MPASPTPPAALSWSDRLARRIRRALGRDRERRWNSEWSHGTWDRLSGIQELAHHAVLAGYLMQLVPQGTVLDVGCGNGRLPQLLPCGTMRYLGVDFAEPVRQAEALQLQGARFTVADMHDFTSTERYDAIVFNESAYYFSDLMRGLRRYETFLAPGGVLLVSMHETPKNQARWATIDRRYATVDVATVANCHGTRWEIRVLAPPTA